MFKSLFCLILVFILPLSSQAKKFHSDMILDPKLISKGGNSKSTGFLAYESTPWPSGVVPLDFDSTFSSIEKKIILNACESWSQVANVSCVERTNQNNFVRVLGTSDLGCMSTVGMPVSGIGTIALPHFCRNRSVILHELGHTFGLAHEHQRPDRDQYVTIHNDVIDNNNYVIFSNIDISFPYDFSSVMHYQFSDLVVPLPEFVESTSTLIPTVGRAIRPSRGDRQSMEAIYGAPVPFTPQNAFGEINSVTSDCTQGANCNVTIEWTGYNAPSAGVRIENRQNRNEYKICTQSPCEISISASEIDFILKEDINNYSSVILDIEKRDLVAFLQAIRTGLTIVDAGIEYDDGGAQRYDGSGPSNSIPVLTMNVKDLIRYRWIAADRLNQPPSSLSGVKATATYTVDQESCGLSGLGPHKLPTFNTNNQFDGIFEETIQECQAGRTYTITYKLETASGNIISSNTVVLNVIDAPVLRANGQVGAITVVPGQNITYEWSTPADYVSGAATVTVVQGEPACGLSGSGPYIWSSITAQNFKSGATSATVDACQAGRKYVIEFKAKKANGQEVTTSLKIKVTSD